jgi:hypothetical protein
MADLPYNPSVLLLVLYQLIIYVYTRVGFRYPLSDKYNEKTRLLGYRYPTPRITNTIAIHSSVEPTLYNEIV